MVAFLSALSAALVGALSAVVVGVWQRQLGRAEGRRAQLDEHRAASLALVGAALAVTEYCERHRFPRGLRLPDPELVRLLGQLQTAAAPLSWPPSSPVSARAALAVLSRTGFAIATAVLVPLYADSARLAPPTAAPFMRHAITMFEAVAAAEAGSPGALAEVLEFPAMSCDPAGTFARVLSMMTTYPYMIVTEAELQSRP